MIALRWEVIPLFQPWAQPGDGTVMAPIASGAIQREDQLADGVYSSDPAVFADCDPITVPPTSEGARFHLLALEVYGWRGWTVTFGTPSAPPVSSDMVVRLIDPVPKVWIPGSYSESSGSAFRSRELRAVLPGSSFIARPWAP